MLSFLLARDTMHQNQWLAAIKELEEEGLEMTPVPRTSRRNWRTREFAYQFLNFSEGTESAQGRWARGPAGRQGPLHLCRSTARPLSAMKATSIRWNPPTPTARRRLPLLRPRCCGVVATLDSL